ncbi:MAG: UDP-N-acetylmuramate--L-alanine ligase [Chlamydiales bacterium]|nr:UDP-N-acetylmuramate--L-alanine ligase [Chlamydiales bacterium]NCF70312.1 UDP-N-acetylmuramate--L-alanine ligase [Chlamydiales bacterium]
MKHVHFIGIGGIGMSGLAKMLAQNEYQVSGLDQKESKLTKELESLGVQISYGDDSAQLPDKNAWVVYSTAITDAHPHFSRLKEKGYRMLHRSELLQEIAKDKQLIAVSGTHGKTSTSSLLSYTLSKLDNTTSFAIGGIVQQLGTNAQLANGKYFVAEADESDGTFLNYKPAYGVLTNLEPEHMAHYKTEATLNEAFGKFAEKVSDSKHFYWCGDCPQLGKLDLPGLSYGFGEDCDIKISNYRQDAWQSFFDLDIQGEKVFNIEVRLVGKHQAQNTAIVFSICHSLGYSPTEIKSIISSYLGVKRRSEICLENKYLSIIDDYGHHPTEIEATLEAISKVYFDRRIIAVFQPHRYSRLSYSYDEFCKAFSYADNVIVNDVYGAGEPIDIELQESSLAEDIKTHSLCDTDYVSLDDTLEHLKKHITIGDVVIFFGAGSITKYAHQTADYFEKNPPKKLHVGLVCGGVSPEHKVSLVSSRAIYEHLDRDLYDVSVIAISQDGLWSFRDTMPEGELVDSSECQPFYGVASKLEACDIFFPMIHGQNGEDGSFQGFFEILSKPYVGCDFRAASSCMDKAKTKHIIRSYGFATSNWLDFHAKDWKEYREDLTKRISFELSYPVFVKPCHLGSSVGISKCENEKEMIEAVDLACSYDYKVLVEEHVEGREIEFAVLGNQLCFTPPPGEILTGGNFYDYEKKYGDNPYPTTPRAIIPEELLAHARRDAIYIYQKLGCKGFARVDGFLNKKGEFILNEVNPLPGFTPISLFPKIWIANGLEYPKILERLINLGRKRKRDESDLLAKRVLEEEHFNQETKNLVMT